MSSLDFLSYVLSFLRVNSSSLFIFDLTEPFGIETAEVVVPISLTVTEGRLWLVVPEREPILLESGDTILLPRGTYGKNHALLSSPEERAEDVAPLLTKLNVKNMAPGVIMERPIFVSAGGGGGLTRIVSATFGFDVHRLGPLMAALPELMVVRCTEKERVFTDAILANLLDMDPELPGFAAMAAQTAQLLLTHVVRAFALTGRTDDIGWLAGLADPRIARALTSIHQSPGRSWNVAQLARIAGLSRSGFAEKFHERLGQTPMHYLRSWRMHLAQEALASSDVTVTSLTQNLGYQSEAAFREAFRQATGQTPKDFRRRHPSRVRQRRSR
ncbi:MAG: cupin domain-containing protein [Novosphingobium sp.]